MNEIISLYLKSESLKEVARVVGISEQKVRKVLLTAGITIDNARTIQIMQMFNSGMSPEEIAVKLKISKRAVNAHLPYIKGEYNIDSPSANALRIRKCRHKEE